ncbi:FAD-dependent monooxygenase [Amycolatopsis aidingensis]|uniref:FAD-dependent monooxygenase n=1 Tax=Amycolatopsis aidingensis TaxID=2842453 RepID=UPI001E2C7F21|nr:FAD-dependent monooxygenase [Amycolatopsis aidingensis]
MVYDERTPVLIVGGGLVGLSAALFLSWHGVSSILVERHAGTSIHPRAWGWYPRTLELLRMVGVERQVMRESAGFVGHTLNGKVESLAGKEISLTTIPDPEDVSDMSPIGRVVSLSQDRLEPILLDRAKELGGELRFGTELTGLEPGTDGVTATVRVRETGAERRIHAQYVIAADGGHSPVRRLLGIGQRGRGILRDQISILFRAELSGPLGDRRFAVCQVENDLVEGILGHDDSLRQGTLIVTYRQEDGERPEDYDEERCTELVRAAVGDPGLEVRIREILPWQMASLHAERFSSGRVFLAGDAAHLLPPVGGFGANTGVHDVHNLAWKLEAVLAGKAGPELLETYDQERRPVAVATIEQAGLRLAARGGFATPQQRAALADTLSVTFGYRYDSAAPAFLDPRELTGQPGTRAPHIPIRLSGAVASTLDLFGRNPVLLAGADAQWCSAAERLPRTVDVLRAGHDFQETGRSWHEAAGIEPSGAILVRPDGFVSWRSITAPEGDPAAVLSRQLDRMFRTSTEAPVDDPPQMLAGLPPKQRLLFLTVSRTVSRCVWALAELGVADELACGPKPVTELADAVGADPDLLYRVLRCTATFDVFRELAGGRFALTPAAEPLRRDVPGSLRNLVLLEGHDLYWRSYGALLHSLRTGEPAFDHAFGTSFQPYLNTSPEAETLLRKAMSETNSGKPNMLTEMVDLSSCASVVDINGGEGRYLAALLMQYPHCTGVLFGRPGGFAEAARVFAERGVADRACTITGDPCTAVPAGHDAYVLKQVLHELADEQAVRVLRSVRAAIGSAGHSRLFLVEHLVGMQDKPDMATLLDVDMLVTTGGRERSLDDWRQLAGAAGFQVDDSTGAHGWAVLRCRPS